MKNWLNTAKQRRWGAWNCAFYALLAVVGFVSLNVAGCGGGGGGTPVTLANVTLRFRDINNNPVNGTGTITAVRVNAVGGGRFTSTFTTAGGEVVVPNVPPGEYTVSGTINGTNFTQRVAVGRDGNQTFVIIPGGLTGTLVTGRIFLNRGDAVTGNCQGATADQAVTARVLIRVRRVADNVIIASFERPQQSANTPDVQKGTFVVTLPPGAYRLEVRQAAAVSATEAPAPITGNSPTFNVPATTFVTICANEGPIAPGGTPLPTATFTPIPTIDPLATPTATPIDPPVPTFTPTPTTRPTPTNTPGGPPPNPTFTPAPTFTPNPFGTATPTPIGGGGGGNPIATATGGPPPAPLSVGRKR